jgi:hypothetical protein
MFRCTNTAAPATHIPALLGTLGSAGDQDEDPARPVEGDWEGIASTNVKSGSR